MIAGFNMSVPVIAGLVDSIIDKLGAQDRRNHELRMKDLQIIQNSNLKDEYVRQLLLKRSYSIREIILK